MEHDEKKWFVYLGDHHEGPFTLLEIQGQMAEGHVTTANYVWCEGMGDWQLMSEVAAFAALQQPAFKQASGGEFAESPSPAFASPAMEALPAVDEPYIPESASPVLGAAEPVAYPDSASPIAAPMEDAAIPSISRPEPSLGAQIRTAPASMAIETGAMSASAINAGSAIQLERPPSERAAVSEEAVPPQRFRNLMNSIGRLIPPLIGLSVIGGGVFAYTAGYLDPVFANPGVRAFQRTVGDTTRPYLLKLSEKFPVLQGLISAIPHFDDLPDADYQRLGQAAMLGPQNGGPRVAMALSSDSAQGPAFFAAGNVPDGTRLEVRIYGVEDSLLNQLSFSGSEIITITKRIGKSAPIHAADGKPVPKGQYVTFLMESADDSPVSKAAMAGLPAVKLPETVPADAVPKDAKILAVAPSFIGGPRDATYEARLREYHAKLAAKAADELREVHQFADTLQSQLDATVRVFSGIIKTPRGTPIVGKIPPLKVKGWETFDQQWAQLSTTLNQTFGKWTPDTLAHEYFYGSLYQLTEQAGQAIDLLHKVQQLYFVPTSDRAQVEGQLSQVGALATSTLSNLKTKIEQAEKLPPTANGMPRRDGI